MTCHAKDALRCPGVAQVFNLSLAIATLEATGTEGLLAGENGQVFDLVAAGAATVGTVVADERAVAEKKQVGIRIEEGSAGVATEAVDVPAISSLIQSQWVESQGSDYIRVTTVSTRNQSETYLAQRLFLLPKSAHTKRDASVMGFMQTHTEDEGIENAPRRTLCREKPPHQGREGYLECRVSPL